MNFTLPAVGSITTSTGNTAGILGGWATIGHTDWAVNSAGSGTGNIAALSSYQINDLSSSANNVSITANNSPATAFVINSLRFNTAGSSAGGLVLTLPDAGGGISNVNSGGILVTPNVGAYGATIASTSVNADYLEGAGGGANGSTSTPVGLPLIVNQFNANGALNFTAPFAGPLIKNGPGTLNLGAGTIAAANSTMIGSYLNQGTLAMNGQNLPEDTTNTTPWLTVTANASVQFYTSYGGGIGPPPSPNMFEDVMVVNAGATLTIDNIISTNFGNTGSSSDNCICLGIMGTNLPVPHTTYITGDGSLAMTNSFGDSLFTQVRMFNEYTGNSYSGTTTIYGGQVQLRYNGTVANVNKLNPNATLYLGGVLTIFGPTVAPATETVGATLNLIANSASAVAITNSVTSVANPQINLTGNGTIVRNSGSTLAVTQFDATVAVHLGNVATPGGILGGWATYGLTCGRGASSISSTAEYLLAVTDWATLDGNGNVVALAAANYTNDVWASGNNTTVTTSSSPPINGITNSLRFVSATTTTGIGLSQMVTLSGANTIVSGGILVTANFTTVNSFPSSSVITTGTDTSTFTLAGGSLTSGNGQDLILNDFNTLSGSSLTIASQITGNIGLTASGTSQAIAGKGGIIILANPNNNNNYTGATAIGGATVLRIGAAAGQQLPLTSAVVLSGDSTFDLNGNNQSIGSLASISYGTIVTGGMLTVGNDNTNTTFNGQFRNGSGSFSLVKTGTGTLTLGFVPYYLTGVGFAASNYTGGTTINDSTISIMSDTSLGGASGGLIVNGTTAAPSILQAAGTFSSARTIQLGPTSGTGFGTFDVVGPYTLTLTGAIGNQSGGSGGLVKVDNGTLVLTNSGNSYSGGTQITGGILNINADGNFGGTAANPNITFNGSGATGGGTLQFASAFSGASLSSGRNITVAANDSGTIDTNGNNITWGGVLTVGNSATLTKTGTGSFAIQAAPTLNNNSALAVSAGTLRFNVTSGGPATIGTGATATVAAGATLELAGSVPALGTTAGIPTGNLVSVVNNSQAATTGGLHVTGTNQLAGAITGTGNMVVESGAGLTAYQIKQNSLTINGTGKVTLIPSGSGSTTNPAAPNNINFSSNVGSLSIAGAPNAWTGTLDIGNNGLVIQYGAGSDPFTTITNMVKSGYANGAWTGTRNPPAWPGAGRRGTRLAYPGAEHRPGRLCPEHRHLRFVDPVRGSDDHNERRAGAIDVYG